MPDYEHDGRLDDLENGQYRMWHDGEKILVPVGMSTTKPLTPEIIESNTRVYGTINKSYFNRPEVDFTNTNVNIKRFDKFYLQIWRDMLPENPDIGWADDLGIHNIRIKYNVYFTVAVLGITGRSGGICDLNYNGKGQNGNDNWVSQVMQFDDYNLKHLRGDFIIVTNPTSGQATVGAEFTTAKFLQPNNLPISVIVNDVTIQNGISQMDIILKNTYFTVTLQSFDFEVVGAE